MNKLKYFFITLLVVVSFCRCDDDSSYLRIQDVNLHYEFKDIGGTRFASIESNKTFTAVSNQEWCYTEVYSGGRTNNLRITARNNELAQSRNATITIESEGMEPIQIAVEQKPSPPFIHVSTPTVTISDDFLNFSLEINANTTFTFTLPEWIKHVGQNVPEIGRHTYNFIAESIIGGEREAEILLTGTGTNNELKVHIPIKQSKELLPLIDETFDWATGSLDIFTSSGEIRMDNWPIEGQAWTSTTPGVYDVWTRDGYLKFCRGNTGADLVSPKLTGLNGVHDVIVTFKACGYLTPSGIKDKYHEFNISVIGGGTPSVTRFEVTNYPDTQAREHGEGWQWQDDPNAEYTFKIFGATSETQIVFLAGPNLGRIPDGHSRMGFDDVKVIIDIEE